MSEETITVTAQLTVAQAEEFLADTHTPLFWEATEIIDEACRKALDARPIQDGDKVRVVAAVLAIVILVSVLVFLAGVYLGSIYARRQIRQVILGAFTDGDFEMHLTDHIARKGQTLWAIVKAELS